MNHYMERTCPICNKSLSSGGLAWGSHQQAHIGVTIVAHCDNCKAVEEVTVPGTRKETVAHRQMLLDKGWMLDDPYVYCPDCARNMVLR